MIPEDGNVDELTACLLEQVPTERCVACGAPVVDLIPKLNCATCATCLKQFYPVAGVRTGRMSADGHARIYVNPQLYLEASLSWEHQHYE